MFGQRYPNVVWPPPTSDSPGFTIGDKTYPFPPDSDDEEDFWEWFGDHLMELGESILTDDRYQNMEFHEATLPHGVRPVTNMEMMACSLAVRYGWFVASVKWMQSFDTFLEGKLSECQRQKNWATSEPL